ncbi:hypothetical protein ABPG75_000171 [Micractinium tetrahymenae]
MDCSASYARALLRRLRIGDEAAQQAAAKALGRLASSGASQCEAIAAAGGIPALARCLAASRSATVLDAVAGALVPLVTDSQSSALQLVQSGAVLCIPRLVRSSSKAVVMSACALAGSLAGMLDDAFAGPFLAAGGMAALIDLLESAADEHVQAAVLGALTGLTALSPGAQEAAAGSAPAPLARLLHTSGSIQVLHGAAALAHNLARQGGKDALLAAGSAAALLAAMDRAGGDAAMQNFVATALQSLSCDSLPAKAAITAAGGVQAMVHLLHSPDPIVRCSAAAVLHNMSDDARDPIQQARSGLQWPVKVTAAGVGQTL